MLIALFWNLNDKRRESLCANLARRHRVSFAIFAECPRPPELLKALNSSEEQVRYYWHRTGNRLTVFSRYSIRDFLHVDSTTRYSIHALFANTAHELILVSVHATSGLRVPVSEQDEELRALAKRISEIEMERGHTRTLIIGDLNADPFDRRVTSATGLHAQMSRTIAGQRMRRVKGVEYLHFYNPMWRFLGQQHPLPQGTYYRRKAEHDTRFWHVFDQVLLRPDLLPYFQDEDVSILLDDGVAAFQKTDGTPNPKIASDHFPILVKLDFTGEET